MNVSEIRCVVGDGLHRGLSNSAFAESADLRNRLSADRNARGLNVKTQISHSLHSFGGWFIPIASIPGCNLTGSLAAALGRFDFI